MRHLGRILAALLLGALSIFGAGLPASAATTQCVEPTPGYEGSGVCSVTVTKAVASCRNDVYSVTYTVTTKPDTAATVNLVWKNPAGPDFTQTGQPLAATVSWPSSVPKVALDVQFTAGATATVRVDPTLVSENCGRSGVLVSNPTSSSGVLSSTGAEIMPFALTGGGLLLAGAALLAVRASRMRRLNTGNE